MNGFGEFFGKMSDDRELETAFAASCCRNIWASVIAQAIVDLLDRRPGECHKKEIPRLRESAKRFLFSSDSDFAFEAAGINAEAARKVLLARKPTS